MQEPPKPWVLSAEQRKMFEGSAPFGMLDGWLKEFKEPNRAACTLLDLGGGKYKIPLEREPEFLALLAVALQRQEQLDAEEMARTERRLAHLDRCRQRLLQADGELAAEPEAEESLAQDWRSVLKRASERGGGGSGALPPRDELLAAIAEQRSAIERQLVRNMDENANTTCFYVERRTPVFLYMLDLDFAEPTQQVDAERMLSYARIVQDVLFRFYKRQFELVLCHVPRIEPIRPRAKAAAARKAAAAAAPAPAPPPAAEVLYKHGYHVYALDLWVTEEQALTIRELLLSELQERHGPRTVRDNDWTQVVDQSIYIGNGLRVAYASKAYIAHCEGRGCAKCKGDPKAQGEHKVYERWRRYVPWRVLAADGGGEWDAARLAAFRDKHYTLRALSIRWAEPRDPTPGYARPRDAPQYFPTLKHLEAVRSRDAALAEAAAAGGADADVDANADAPPNDDEFSNDRECTAKFKNRREVRLDEPVRAALQRALRQFELPYRNVVLQRVLLIDNPNPYMIAHVRGAGSQFCKNKGADHKGNRIWFYICRAGIMQKCFRRCPTREGRVAGLCSAYKSHLVPLPPTLSDKLFPNAAKKRSSAKSEPPAKRLAREVADPLAVLRE